MDGEKPVLQYHNGYNLGNGQEWYYATIADLQALNLYSRLFFIPV